MYTYRDCNTCDIKRKPKSTHCRVCNNCVIGFDHHCVFVNQCIGKRNIRAYMGLLLLCYIFALSTGITGLITLLDKPVIETIQNGENLDFQRYDLIVVSVICALQTIKFIIIMLSTCCKVCTSVGLHFIWIITEFFICLILGAS